MSEHKVMSRCFTAGGEQYDGWIVDSYLLVAPKPIFHALIFPNYDNSEAVEYNSRFEHCDNCELDELFGMVHPGACCCLHKGLEAEDELLREVGL